MADKEILLYLENEVKNVAYSELIKSFSKIRSYINEFYIYGFKSRNEYSEKSARSYDNEKRRIESWLGDYVSCKNKNGEKNVYLSVDSRAIARNPFYSAFKSKSFTSNDISLHFYILDILYDGKRSVSQIVEGIAISYLNGFENAGIPDESTIRKKLSEYERLGIITKEKRGREVFYSASKDTIDLDMWKTAVSFFSEEDELGVIGSFVLDRYDSAPDYFSFKHHYILHALESEILYDILLAIDEGRNVKISTYASDESRQRDKEAFPLKIYISVQSGRRYLLCRDCKTRKMLFFRLDKIKKITALDIEKNAGSIKAQYEKFAKSLWGVDTGNHRDTEHIEMEIYFGDGEEYIINRLKKEKRCGTVKIIDKNHCRFIADVYSAEEMLPWLRTFIGRITRLECSNKYVTGKFFFDLEKMKELYGGDSE